MFDIQYVDNIFISIQYIVINFLSIDFFIKKFYNLKRIKTYYKSGGISINNAG